MPRLSLFVLTFALASVGTASAQDRDIGGYKTWTEFFTNQTFLNYLPGDSHGKFRITFSPDGTMTGVQLNNGQTYSGTWKVDESQGQLCTQWIGGNAGCATVTLKDNNTVVSSDTVEWTIVATEQQTKATSKPKSTPENLDASSPRDALDVKAVRSAARKRLLSGNADHTKLHETAIAGGYALQSWSGDNMGGQALLKYDSTDNRWVVLTAGGGASDVSTLVGQGVPQDTAQTLLAKLNTFRSDVGQSGNDQAKAAPTAAATARDQKLATATASTANAIVSPKPAVSTADASVLATRVASAGLIGLWDANGCVKAGPSFSVAFALEGARGALVSIFDGPFVTVSSIRDLQIADPAAIRITLEKVMVSGKSDGFSNGAMTIDHHEQQLRIVDFHDHAGRALIENGHSNLTKVDVPPLTKCSQEFFVKATKAIESALASPSQNGSPLDAEKAAVAAPSQNDFANVKVTQALCHEGFGDQSILRIDSTSVDDAWVSTREALERFGAFSVNLLYAKCNGNPGRSRIIIVEGPHANCNGSCRLLSLENHVSLARWPLMPQGVKYTFKGEDWYAADQENAYWQWETKRIEQRQLAEQQKLESERAQQLRTTVNNKEDISGFTTGGTIESLSAAQNCTQIQITGDTIRYRCPFGEMKVILAEFLNPSVIAIVIREFCDPKDGPAVAADVAQQFGLLQFPWVVRTLGASADAPLGSGKHLVLVPNDSLWPGSTTACPVNCRTYLLEVINDDVIQRNTKAKTDKDHLLMSTPTQKF